MRAAATLAAERQFAAKRELARSTARPRQAWDAAEGDGGLPFVTAAAVAALILLGIGVISAAGAVLLGAAISFALTRRSP